MMATCSPGYTSFADAALALLENGYEPLPIRPGTKRPAPRRWTTVNIGADLVGDWSERYGDCGIGLRTGALVGVDIDLLDPDLAHLMDRLVRLRLGDTPLMRVGRWPKRVLLYRTEAPFPKLAIGKVEVLALGQQLVAFGTHPETRQPYSWPLGDTPFDTSLAALPCVDAERCREVLAEAGSMLPAESRWKWARIPPGAAVPPTASGPVRDDAGLVVDGRDGWLSRIAFHAVHDALAEGAVPDADAISRTTWQRFSGSADLRRPRQDGHRAYRPDDAARKVADKLRLHAEGRLPPRVLPAAEADYKAPGLGAAAAREKLGLLLGRTCAGIEEWHAGSREAPPRVAIRATVGLGKSVLARRHLLELRRRLLAMGAPSRIVVFAPSHALAEEAAGSWRDTGLGIAVLRGYEARDPATRQPMCRDIDAVRIATRAGVDVHSAVAAAAASTDSRRRAFDATQTLVATVSTAGPRMCSTARAQQPSSIRMRPTASGSTANPL